MQKIGQRRHAGRQRFALGAGCSTSGSAGWFDDHQRGPDGRSGDLADWVQVQQVLINLIRHAIEAMADAARRELTIASQTKGADWIEISVADTGLGLAPEVAGRLFQPFVTSKQNGRGVGLSICRTIIETHGGRIRAEGGPQGGCVFRFTLPRASEGVLEDA